MRVWFERLPIHRKLVASALLITAVALTVAMLGLSAFDVWRYRAAAAEDARALASVLAENAAAAVMFEQDDAAQELLQSVRVRDVVTRVCLYLPEGRLFTGFSSRAGECPAARPSDDVWSGVFGTAPIMRNGRMHGVVVVERSLSDLERRLLLTGAAGLIMFVCAALAAYLLAQRVNAAISRPITALATAARQFGAAPDADLPVIRTAPDELGALVTAFGDMITRVRTSGDELRRSNEALRRETAEREAALVRQLDTERRLKTLADGSPVLLWVNGPDGCEFVNRAYLEFVGLDRDADVRGYDWARYVHPDDRAEYLGAYGAALRSRTPFQAEFRFRRADGEFRWMRSEATPRMDHGVFAGYVGASVDITERRRAEEALREADQRKDAFLAVLAHELRNPLAPLRAGIALLQRQDVTSGGAQPLLSVLERQVIHMVRLIDDLLDVSRITSGKIQLQRQPVPLHDVVAGAIEANRAAVDAAGLTLTVTLPTAPCLLDVDQTRLVQVLSNLLNNSTKFTERGGRIDVTASVDASVTPAQLSLTIADTGAGIAPSMLPHVFDFFVQGDTPGRAKSGLGIGLGLARQLVELHGGTIQASSDGAGRGSMFTIRLPVVTLAVAPAVSDSELVPPAGHLGIRVLVVDDNVDAADTLTALVAAMGGEAIAAYSGQEGLQRAADMQPDVVLLDLGMPEMDGYETCRRLRAGPGGRLTYVVAVTGFGQEHDRQRAMRSGFDAHLTKPADPRMLETLLAGISHQRQRASQNG